MAVVLDVPLASSAVLLATPTVLPVKVTPVMPKPILPAVAARPLAREQVPFCGANVICGPLPVASSSALVGSEAGPKAEFIWLGTVVGGRPEAGGGVVG